MKLTKSKKTVSIVLMITMMVALLLTGCGEFGGVESSTGSENVATEETVANEKEFDPWAYFGEHNVIGLTKDEAEAKIGDLEEVMTEGGGMWYATEDDLSVIFTLEDNGEAYDDCLGMSGFPEQILGLEPDVTLEEIRDILGIELTAFENMGVTTVGSSEYAGSFNYNDKDYSIIVLVYDEEFEGHRCRISIYK